MWYAEITKLTNANKDKIWQLWKDVPNWKEWDKDVEYSSIEGNFEIGNKGVLKSKGGPESKFEIIACKEYSLFTNRSTLPLCTIDFIHSITSTKKGNEITHRVEMKGLLTFLFSRIIGWNIEKGLSNAVESLIKLAENEE